MPPPRPKMYFIDRYRSIQGVDAGGRRLRSLDGALIDHDRGGAGAQLGDGGERVGLQRQHLAVMPDELVLVFVTGLGLGHEDFPEAVAAYPHGVASSIPQIEIADHAHPLGGGCENREGDARHAVEHHRMGAQLVVEMHVRPFAEKVKVQIRQDRWEPIRIFDLDLTLAIAYAHAIAGRPVRQTALEQTNGMNALLVAFMPLLIDDGHPLGIRKEDAHDRHVAFEMRAEIAEGVGVPTLDDRIGFRAERGHSDARSERERMRSVPARGTRSQSGRCASSYSIS